MVLVMLDGDFVDLVREWLTLQWDHIVEMLMIGSIADTDFDFFWNVHLLFE